MEQRAEQRLSPKSRTFTAVIDEYVKFRAKNNEHGRTSEYMLKQIKRVVKFWKEYAGKKAVELVDDKVLRGSTAMNHLLTREQAKPASETACNYFLSV